MAAELNRFAREHFLCIATTLCIPQRDSIPRPIVPVASVAGENDMYD
jgi:hypothetical protein